MSTIENNSNTKVLKNQTLNSSFLIWIQFLFPQHNIDNVDKIFLNKSILIDYLSLLSIDNEFDEFIEIIDYIKDSDIAKEILGLFSLLFEVFVIRILDII